MDFYYGGTLRGKGVKMRISLVSVQLGMGGAENLVCNLADRFVARGHEVQLISLLGEPVVVPKSSHVTIHNLRIMKRNPASWLSGIYYFCRAIKKFKPDVVHAHSFHSIILARLMRPILNYPKLISTGHNQREGEGIQGKIYKLTDRLSDVMTNISLESTDALNTRLNIRKKAITVYNGINSDVFRFSFNRRSSLRKELDIDDGEKLLVAIGRLNPQKDYPNLIEALKIIEQKNPTSNIKVAIIGDGDISYKRELRQMVGDKLSRTQVNFLGIRRDIPDCLSAADIFVLSSAWEGFGLVVAEAMSCERVVVATDAGGVREVVGDAGFICPPQNAEALATALTQAMSLSAPEAEALGKKARDRVVQNFSLDAAVDRWLELYTRI
ncbi:glycosyltransferase [Deinococcus taklimakanensis]|uniref:Glycosyltransferase n=1 Tax=Deinococcus taklimakanensis TaxID=536443 RepID=A0ABW5P281_9DEIO